MKSLSKLFVSLILLHVIVVSLSHTLSTQRYFAEDSNVDEVSESMTAQQPVDENIYEENMEIVDNIIDEKDDTVVAEEGLQASESENEEFSESTTANNSTSIEEVEVSDSKDSGVLYSGINGTSNWKIFENGLLLIGSGELANTGNNRSPWSAYASEITDIEFEVGVYAPAGSTALFKGLKATSFIEINNFDTSKVTNMTDMFNGMSNLSELDVSKFNTSKVTSMSHMFGGMSKLSKLDVRNFNTLKVTNMSNMFYNMSSLSELDVSTFNTSNVTSMSNMFNGMNSLPVLDVSNFDTSKVTSMSHMFGGMSKLSKLDVRNFNTLKVTNMSNMFYNMSSLSELDVSTFNTSNVTSMSNMFNGMNSLPVLDVSNFDTSKVTYMNSMFSRMSSLLELDLSNFDTEKVTYMNSMFNGMSNLVELDMSSFDTSEVTDMSYMLSNMSSLSELDVSNFDTSKVTSMGGMFNGMSNLSELDVSTFNTSNVTSMSNMFNGMNSLPVLDVSNFDTSNVTNMSSMFNGMSNLVELDMSSFDTSKVTDMSYMLSNMSSLSELDVRNFNTLKVTNMGNMFYNMRSLVELDVSNFDTSNVTNMRYMFGNNISLNSLSLGNNFRFIELTSVLPSISKKGYTGKWIGTTTGMIFKSSLDLATNFAGQADTYVWEEYVVVDPPEENPGVTIPPTVPSSGPLTIAYASQFNFGEQMISTNDQTYSVLSEKQELADGIGQAPYVSFAQIQDTRVSNDGWSLSVTASEFTSNTQNNVLAGSQLTLGSPSLIRTGSSEDAISMHDDGLQLIPGASSLLMASEKGQGRGITSIVWGNQGTLNNSVDEKVRNDAIQLVVPGSTTKDATTYKAILSWELLATPGNEL